MSTTATASTIVAKVVTPLRADQTKLLRICLLILGTGKEEKPVNAFELSLLKSIAQQLARSISYDEVSPDIRTEDRMVLLVLRDLCDSLEKSPSQMSQNSLHFLDKLYGTHGQLAPRLTERETEVLRLIADGFTNKEIAVQIKVGVRTVESHRERIMRKLDIHNAAGLAKFAITHNILPLRSA